MNSNSNSSGLSRFLNIDFRNADVILFLLSVALLFFVFGFSRYLFLIPQGIHFWRQTDSLSFTLGYYYFESGFFSPSILNADANNCHCASEFPIVYYLAALFYRVSVEHVAVLKILNTSIVLIGFFYFYKLLKELFNEQFYALVFTMLYLSSGILLYYGIGVIPDPPALGFTLIGFYFYYQFIQKTLLRYLWLALLFLTLGSLIRISFALIPVSLFAVTVLNYLFNKKRKIIHGKLVVSFLITVLIYAGSIAAWNVYVIKFNEANSCFFFLTSINAIWQKSDQTIHEVYQRVSNGWFGSYYYFSTWHTFFVLAALAIVLAWKNTFKNNAFALVLLLGSVAYVLLFYFQFYDHDYYFLALLPVIMIMTSFGFANVLKLFPQIIRNPIARIALVVLVFLSFNFASKKLEARYETGERNYHARVGFRLRYAKEVLEDCGVPQDAKIAVLPEHTPNGALYFLKRQGHVIEDTSESSFKKIRRVIDEGTEYCCITDASYLQCNALVATLGQEVYADRNFRLYKFKQNENKVRRD
ncbi:MAG: glycosyltransferase family 39 protein [Bacteroidetes bacterium]|nr:glycosyltransferase family 39 protein [Bacteroidota bacterium]